MNEHGYDPNRLSDAKRDARTIVVLATELQGMLDKCEAAHLRETQTTHTGDQAEAVNAKLDSLAAWALQCVCDTLHAFPECGRLPVAGLMAAAGKAQAMASGEWTHALERTAEKIERRGDNQ